MELKDLRKIGLTDGEIKVYEALLEIGECTKTALATKSGIAPSNIYDVTNRLVEKGMISKVEKNGISHFSAANPTHILDFLGQKEKELQNEKDFVNQMLPTLLLKFKETKEKVNVEVFQGWNGMKTVFEDLLNECGKGDQCFVIGASKGASEKQADIFFLKYSKLREEKGIITNIIFNESIKERKERIEYFLKSDKYHVKFLRQNTPTEIMIYKNKTCIISLTKNPIIIRVTSQETTDSFKQYFNVMWKKYSEMYEGIEGVKELLLELLEAGGTDHHTFGSAKESLMLGAEWWMDYHKKRAAKGIKAKLLFNESLKKWSNVNLYPEAEYKFTKTGFEPLTETIIRNDKIGIILWTEKPIGILIHNKIAAQSYDKFWEIMWNSTK
jgi:sugar-specific transcriptional regulator TrmB